jgi:hypothetical protein
VHILRRVGDLALLGGHSQRQQKRGAWRAICASSSLALGQPIRLCLTRAGDRLDQARVIVLHVADPGADGPGNHLLRREGRERGFELGSAR